ncbi:MAG TPA: CPBP family glutamic-type intramembrane protease [Anaerolineales bacterium]
MDKQISLRIFLGMIVVYAVLAGMSVFLPQGPSTSTLVAPMPAPVPVMAVANAAVVLVVYGGLGLAGFFLARKLGLPELWDTHMSSRLRFLNPALVGATVGLVIIVADLIFSPINGVGRLPHPPFPTSLVASITAGIGEETIFRLFFISFWTWLVSSVLLRGRFQTPVYWVVSLFSAAAFGLGHLPSIMFLEGWTSMAQVPGALLAELLLLNGLISLAAAYMFKKYGFLAPVGVHFWCDVVWHVLWGAL